MKDRLTRRKTHRLAAHVTREDEWDYDAPNIRLSRAFVVVIILHIVAVGGILAFEVFKPDGQRLARLTEDDPESLVQQEPMQLSKVIPARVKIGDPSVAGYDHYIVKAGDNVANIADRHGVSIAELERLNRLDQGSKIYPGKALFIPPHPGEDPTAENVASVLQGGGSPDGSGGVLAANQAEALPPGDSGVGSLPDEEGDLASIPSPEAGRARQPDPVPEIATPAPEPAVKEKPKPAPQLVVTDPPAEKPETPPVPRTIPKPEIMNTSARRTGGSYVVAKGDTAYGIARRHGVDPASLLRANGIKDPTNLQIGQKLNIPQER